MLRPKVPSRSMLRPKVLSRSMLRPKVLSRSMLRPKVLSRSMLHTGAHAMALRRITYHASTMWLNLFLLILLWLSTVALAMAVLARLFPPLRGFGEREENLVRPQVGALRVTDSRTTRLNGTSAAPTVAVVPGWINHYWQSTLRIIGPLLVIWFFSFVFPALLADTLNRFEILTGFPLGYYMGAQGSLLIFICLIFIYSWRMARLDRRFQLETAPLSSRDRQYHRRLLVFFIAFTIGLVLMITIIGLLDAQFGLPPALISWSFLLFTIAVYALIGLRARTENLDEYYVAGRRIPGLLNGLATGSDWMSAASFISMAGALWLLGFEGLAYITGWTGGFVLLVLFLAPYLRKFGQYTIPDFIGARYEGATTRVVAAVITIIISFTYLTAQVTGVGIIMSRFLGVNYMFGVIIGLAAVLLCSFLGGMKAITWTQGVQGIILVVAYLVPVTWISLQFTGVPLPQLMYGEALRNIALLEAIQGIDHSYVEPFNDWTVWNYIALTLCLMCGTAGLPHILIRFYTVPTVRESRSSVGWALVWISMLYFTAPAYAAFSRWEILQDVVGQPVTQLPTWATNWASTGLLTIADAVESGGNGDGLLQFDELRIDQDLVVLATPEIAGLPPTVVALVAAGGLAAALSTADGLLLVIASAAAHDIYHRTLNPRASRGERLWLGRFMILAAALLAALTAIQRLGIIVQMVAWAFSLAAASFFPVLVLGIFWKRTTARGAVAGMLSGLIVTMLYMSISYVNPSMNILGISTSAAGIFGLPVNILVTVVVSLLTPPPPPHIQQLVDSLRHP
jgi:cation/acetate symporter